MEMYTELSSCGRWLMYKEGPDPPLSLTSRAQSLTQPRSHTSGLGWLKPILSSDYFLYFTEGSCCNPDGLWWSQEVPENLTLEINFKFN